MLVLLTLLLVGTTLFTFATENNSISKELSSSIILANGLSDKEDVLDFYVQDIVQRSAKDITSKQEFMENARLLFSVYAGSYNEFEREFNQIHDQATLENVEFIDSLITFSFEIGVRHSIKENGLDKLIIEEPYSRTFSAST